MIASFAGDVGTAVINVCVEAGGIVRLLGRVVRALIPPTFDGRELVRHLYRMGNRSLPIIALTAFFTGGIMVIQSGIFVKRFGAEGLVGWGAGYAVFREVGPILIGLMFSGRVGANNTAELATMTVTEQLDGLRALAIDPVGYLLVPRVLAMVVTLLVLTVAGDLVAIVGGALFAKLLLHLEYGTFYHSLLDNLRPWDFIDGLVKAGAFGFAISLTSCHFGVSVKGGAVGVGRAVNAAVVAAAIAVFVLDYFITYLLR